MASRFESPAERGSKRKGLIPIGQFSRVTGLSLKTLRLYHENGLLPPSVVDSASGYRYYGKRDVERARLIADLRVLEIPLAEIRKLLDEYEDGKGIVHFLESQRDKLRARQSRLQQAVRDLDRLIDDEKTSQLLAQATPEVVTETVIAPLLVAGLRWTGSYSDTGAALGKLSRRLGRHATAPPLNLYYDLEHKDGDADIETCVPLRVNRTIEGGDGVLVRTLPERRVARLIHRGAYSELGRSYLALWAHLEANGYDAALPIREIYVKGPGVLLRGNPRNYLTELQVPIVQS